MTCNFLYQRAVLNEAIFFSHWLFIQPIFYYYFYCFNSLKTANQTSSNPLSKVFGDMYLLRFKLSNFCFLKYLTFLDTLGESQRTYLLGSTSNCKISRNGSEKHIGAMNVSKNFCTSSGNSYQLQQHYVPVRSSFRSVHVLTRLNNGLGIVEN